LIRLPRFRPAFPPTFPFFLPFPIPRALYPRHSTTLASKLYGKDVKKTVFLCGCIPIDLRSGEREGGREEGKE